MENFYAVKVEYFDGINEKDRTDFLLVTGENILQAMNKAYDYCGERNIGVVEIKVLDCYMTISEDIYDHFSNSTFLEDF